MIGRRAQHDAQAFDEAWNGRNPRDHRVAELVRCAEMLCEAAAVEPSSAFRDSLRGQLMVEAETALVPVTHTTAPASRVAPAPLHPHPVRRRVAALTAALVASAGVVGLVTSSASADPGEMLYPVKRGVESVELALHRDDASRGEFQLTQASERLAETRRLSTGDGDSTARISDTLDDFSSQAESGSAALFDDYTANGSTTSITTVNDFAASAGADLASLSARMPEGADPSFASAAEVITNLAKQASSMCASCATADLQSLVSAVTGEINQAPPKDVNDSAKKSSSPDSKSPKKASDADDPSVTPTKAAPAPADVPTVTPQGVRGATDPVVGLLLGDDKQEGVVPGLLNGVLGGGKIK